MSKPNLYTATLGDGRTVDHRSYKTATHAIVVETIAEGIGTPVGHHFLLASYRSEELAEERLGKMMRNPGLLAPYQRRYTVPLHPVETSQD